MICLGDIFLLGPAGRQLAIDALEAAICRGDHPAGLLERLILDRALAFESRNAAEDRKSSPGSASGAYDPFRPEPAAILRLRRLTARFDVPQAVTAENDVDATGRRVSGQRIAAAGVRLNAWLDAERTVLEAAIGCLPEGAIIAPLVPATLSALALPPLGVPPERAAERLTIFNRSQLAGVRSEARDLLRSLQTAALHRAAALRDIDGVEAAEEAARAWAVAMGFVSGRAAGPPEA